MKVDPTACREYAQAVYAATEAFIGSAEEDTLGRTIDMFFVGMGQLPLPVMFSIFVTGHLNNLCGEISAVKGALGLRATLPDHVRRLMTRRISHGPAAWTANRSGAHTLLDKVQLP